MSPGFMARESYGKLNQSLGSSSLSLSFSLSLSRLEANVESTEFLVS